MSSVGGARGGSWCSYWKYGFIDEDNLPQALGGKHLPKGPPAFGFL